MFTVYVLKSLKSGKRYVGFTNKSAEDRLHDHNTGSNKWTRAHSPLMLMYTEVFDNKKEAQKREKFLKSGQGRKFLDEILKDRIYILR